MVNLAVKAGTVSWDDAEGALIAAVEYLGLMPDRERSMLAAGSRSCWPQIIRNVRDGDYGEGQGLGSEAAPSARLSRRMMALLDAMLLAPDCAAMAVPEAHRALVGRVIVLKRWPGAEGFGWDRVWRGERLRWDRTGERAVTSDALRMRYERAVSRVAARMERLGLASVGEAG
jgi:hypothetical protein